MYLTNTHCGRSAGMETILSEFGLISFFTFIAGLVFGYIGGVAHTDRQVFDRELAIQTIEMEKRFLEERVNALKNFQGKTDTATISNTAS